MKSVAVILIALLVFLPVQSIAGFQMPSKILFAEAGATSPAASLSIKIDDSVSAKDLLALKIENTASDLEIECVRWNVYSDTDSVISCRGPETCCDDFSLQSDFLDWAEPLKLTEGIGSENLVVADIVYSYIWEEVTSGILPTRRSHQKRAFIGLAPEGATAYYQLMPVDSTEYSDTILPSAPTTDLPAQEPAAGDISAGEISAGESFGQLPEETAGTELPASGAEASGERIPLKLNYKFSENDVVELKVSSDVSSYTSVCTVWDIMVDNRDKKLCFGSTACCNLISMPPSEGVWDTALYLSRDYDWVGENNLITVYVMGSIGEIIPGQLYNIRSSETQRLEVTLPNSAIGVSGTVQLIQPEKELSGVYMELPEDFSGEEAGESADVSVALGPLVQGEIKEGEPVKWYQDIILTNSGQQEIAYTMSLWSQASAIGIDFLSEVSSFRISLEGEVISESSVAIISLLSGQQQKLEITYETAPVTIERSCRDITLAELLPPEATVTGTEILLDTPIKTACSIRVYHDTVTHYRNIRVSLPDIDPGSIESIYFVEADTYLSLVDGAIIVPES